jgi:hypothetical protein
MAAGLGYKEFSTGDVLTAADANGYLASQVVMVFASAAARTSAIASPQEGMISYLKDTNSTEYYSGSAWVAIGGSASPLTTKGDLYTFSTVNARLGVGTNNQVLTADSAEATGLKWATPAAASSGLTLVKAQTIGSAVSSVTVTSAFSATYDNYLVTVAGGAGTGNNNLRLTLGATATGYYWSGVYMGWNSTVNGFGSSNGTYFTMGYGSTDAESAHCHIQSPNLAKRTVFTSDLIQPNTSGVQAHYNGYLDDSTQYTAFTLTVDTGTVTGGTIRVYGYQNS